MSWIYDISLHWRHNDHDGVSNHQPHGCLLNGLFRSRSKKTSKLRVTGLCVGNSPGPVNSPHKGLVTRKMFPFDDVIMFPEYFFVCRKHPVLTIYSRVTKGHLFASSTFVCKRQLGNNTSSLLTGLDGRTAVSIYWRHCETGKKGTIVPH